MAFEDFAEAAFRPFLRLIGQFFIEFIGEMLIKGVGYAICRRFSANVDPEGWRVALTGVLFWLVVGVFAVSIYRLYYGA